MRKRVRYAGPSDTRNDDTGRTQMLMIDYREMSWWYWLVTAVLLSLGLTVSPDGFLGAIGVTLCPQ